MSLDFDEEADADNDYLQSWPVIEVLWLVSGDAGAYCTVCTDLIDDPDTTKARCSCGVPTPFPADTRVQQMLDIFRAHPEYSQLMAMIGGAGQITALRVEGGRLMDGHHRITAMYDLSYGDVLVECCD